MQPKVRRLSYFSAIMYNLTGGRAYKGSTTDQAGILKLTTTGRKSGKQRIVHLMYFRDGPAYVITASNAGKEQHPGWFFNVQSNPQVTIDLKDQQVQAVAEVADPEQRNKLWAQLLQVAPMYSGYEKRTKRTIPMVILRPLERPDPAEQH